MPTLRWWTVGLLLTTAGCISHERYQVRPDQLAALNALSPDVRATYAIPATRVNDHKLVYLSGSRIDALASPSFEIRAANRKVKLGVVLTFVGTAISLVGSGLAFFSSAKGRLAGEILAPAAEPIMIAGTVEWIKGALHPPGEVEANQPGVRYLIR